MFKMVIILINLVFRPKDPPDKDNCDFYHSKRGYHPRSINSGLGWNATTMLSHLTFSLFDYAE